jgi:5'(3')-deoxyribonucleotidase
MEPNRDLVGFQEAIGGDPSFPGSPTFVQGPAAGGQRFNKGKLRTDLVPPRAQEEYVKILTKGAEKYAERNWEDGMKWSTVLASLKRHLLAIERGEDYDKETGLLHAAHVMCNAAFLTEYYHTHPEFDDRPHKYLNHFKIGLDVDEVLADWLGNWTQLFNQDMPSSWRFDREIHDKFEQMKDDKDFWLNLPVKTSPDDLPFEPHCYITSRCVPQEWTEEWLDKNGFPVAPVYSVEFGASKVEAAKRSGIDVFVDDKFQNFVDLNKAGICTFLFDAPHNKRYNVGHKRISNFDRFK